MAAYQVVSRDGFKDLYWKRFDSFHFAAKIPVATLVVDEIPKAVTEMPICFLKQETNFLVVALLGLKDNSNLFVAADGSWLSSYVPATFRGYPFALQRSPDGTGVLCFDTHSGLLTKEEAEKFFDLDGSPTGQIQQIVSFLSSFEQQQVLTQSLCAQLEMLNLLKPWSFSVASHATPLTIADMYQVDSNALEQLDGEDLKTIAQSGALALAYGQLFSANNVSKLIARADKLSKEQLPQVKDLAIDLSESSQTLNFDNL